jgi:phosphoglycolate phosphatase-like HAD superfamily hydrolase
MIGDHEHDILAAHSAGAHSVKVNWGDNQNCSQQPLKQFDQVTELANFLINYFKGNKLNETNSAKCYSS